MANLCEHCRTLREQPTRLDVPKTIRRVAATTPSRRAFRYECSQCATEWSWTIGIGWYLNRTTPATLTGEVLGSRIASDDTQPRSGSH